MVLFRFGVLACPFLAVAMFFPFFCVSLFSSSISRVSLMFFVVFLSLIHRMHKVKVCSATNAEIPDMDITMTQQGTHWSMGV